MANGTIITTLSEWLIVLLISFSLIFEFLLHQLEHWIARRHRQLQPALQIIYRELMILGLISFLFIMYQQIARPHGSVVISFEFAHVFIFLLAVFYTLVVLISLYSSLTLSAHWKNMESIDLEQYINAKDQYTTLRLRMHASPSKLHRTILWWFPNFFTLAKYRRLHELLAFHDLRFQLIFDRSLPESFRFYSFLRKIKSAIFIQLVHSHWSLNVIFLLTVVLDIARRYIFGVAKSTPALSIRADDTTPHQADIVEPLFTIVTAIILMLIVQVLALKIRTIYWELTKNTRLYHQDKVSSSTLPSPDPTTPSSPLPIQHPDLASPILDHAAKSRNRLTPTNSAATSSDAPTSDPNVSAFDKLELATPASRPRAVRFASVPAVVDEPPTTLEEIEASDIEQGSVSQPAPDTSQSAENLFRHHKSLAQTGPTLAHHRAFLKSASVKPAKEYPCIVRKLCPRLTRVASPAEKLFWFGSHHFLFWCIEFTMFFATVLMASSLASVLLLAFTGKPIVHINIASLVLAFVSLIFIQQRIAGVLKKYTFVLLLASLLPESLAKEALQHMAKKRGTNLQTESSSSSSDSEGEAGNDTATDQGISLDRVGTAPSAGGLQRRKTITQFMKSEQQAWNTSEVGESTAL